MRMTPRSELERFSREEYQRHFAAAPPKVRNAIALVALGEHRPLRFAGHGYTVPPLTFRVGMQLTVAREVLAADPANVLAATTARRVMHECIRTRNGKPVRRNPFAKLDGPAALSYITDLLHVPDDSPHPPPSGTQTVDLLDGYLEFVRMYPALVGSDGLPVSWAHYVIGVRSLSRMTARETLRLSQALRVAQADTKVWKDFAREQRSAAGWN